nr:hypothetical protein 4 [Alphaproteobacteria bacterium]
MSDLDDVFLEIAVGIDRAILDLTRLGVPKVHMTDEVQIGSLCWVWTDADDEKGHPPHLCVCRTGVWTILIEGCECCSAISDWFGILRSTSEKGDGLPEISGDADSWRGVGTVIEAMDDLINDDPVLTAV